MSTETSNDQIPDLILCLQNSKAFPHAVQNIRLIETHISWVILTGEYAYKIKKPVSLGFLDFSTLEQRKFFCEEELRLNRRTTSELYLEVVPIGETSDGLRIGAVPAIEYALRLLQFPGDARLDQQLKAGLLVPKDMRAMARRLSRFHQSLPPRDDIDLPVAAARSIQPALDNFSHINPDNFNNESLQGLATIKMWTVKQAELLEPIFEARANHGFIRECHGDLHLANLVMLGGRIVPFDCIEFNPDLRWIDTVSDIAFLVMDLVAHDQVELAFICLGTWLEENGDYGSIELLRFYLVYRCMVRVKVASVQSAPSRDSANRGNTMDAHRYLKLGCLLVQAPTPRLVLMHGLSGSGKTWLSEKLTSSLPAIRVRSDLERKRLHRDLEFETGLYGREATDFTYETLTRHCESGLRAGFNMIADATFLRHRHRRLFLELATRLGVQVVILDCSAPVKIMQARIRRRAADQKDASDADLAVLQQQLNDYDELDEQERQFVIHVATDEVTDQTITDLTLVLHRPTEPAAESGHEICK